ncbi:MAG: phage minor head protein [Thermodesulfobacteriota bacterium]|nr:MAG: phage minor head protein [Thermodesulfobacteriota bacterium]
MDARFTSLPFDKAIEFFRQKVNLPTERWTDLWEGMHSRAFVVAGAMKGELLSDLRTAVDDAIAKGTTIQEFRKSFDKTVEKHGWSYKGGRGWRTATIFNTNMRTAYATGHYSQMTDPDVISERPYWQYIGGLSAEPRPEHLEWNGMVLPADDPWWKTHYPPNGWGCKCKVISLSGRELEKQGLKVSKAPPVKSYEWSNPRTGEVIKVPQGIDPGWGYNPGEAAWGRNEALRLMEDKGPWVDLDPRGPAAYGRRERIPADQPKADLGKPSDTIEGVRRALKEAIGGDEKTFRDPTGEGALVTQAIVDHMVKVSRRLDGREAYFPFIPELIESPYEIWVGFAKSEMSGRVAIRKRYVKLLRLDEKDRVLGMYAETRNGLWTGEGFFRGSVTALKNLRKGRLLYGRD